MSDKTFEEIYDLFHRLNGRLSKKTLNVVIRDPSQDNNKYDCDWDYEYAYTFMYWLILHHPDELEIFLEKNHTRIDFNKDSIRFCVLIQKTLAEQPESIKILKKYGFDYRSELLNHNSLPFLQNTLEQYEDQIKNLNDKVTRLTERVDQLTVLSVPKAVDIQYIDEYFYSDEEYVMECTGCMYDQAKDFIETLKIKWIDGPKVDEEAIKLIQLQTECDRDTAIMALSHNDDDIVSAIMDITTSTEDKELIKINRKRRLTEALLELTDPFASDEDKDKFMEEIHQMINKSNCANELAVRLITAYGWEHDWEDIEIIRDAINQHWD